MPVAKTSLVERISRVMAARFLSINADGGERSAAQEVDEVWRDYREDAVSVIRSLREPDPTMAEVGDVKIWERMVEAAIADVEAEAEPA